MNYEITKKERELNDAWSYDPVSCSTHGICAAGFETPASLGGAADSHPPCAETP